MNKSGCRAHRRGPLQRAAIEFLETRKLLAANLVISEFLASNNNNITDSSGNHSDWIEIHNCGDAPADLGNYFLTDNAGDPEQWRFPEQTINAGDYLIVWADGTTTPPVANTELHANFKLGADGEYLGLMNAADDTPAFEYAPTFPAQTADVSYGLFDANDPNSARVFFNTPTPGAQNSTPAAQPAQYSLPGRTFSSSIQVTLSSSTPGAMIYYTTDGSSPTSSSSPYTSTLTLSNTTMLRTIVFAPNYASSPVESESYIDLDSTANTLSTLGSSTVSNFSSNLPIVFVNSFTGGTAISQTTDGAASVSLIDTTNGVAHALDTPNYDGRAGFRERGSSSENYPKKQYTLELWDESNNDKKAALLGMPSQSDWILYAPYTEEIMMQNALAYQWSNEMGHYASRTRYVELFLNKTNTGTVGTSPIFGGSASPTAGADYLGIYILEEKIKISSNRVDVDEISTTNPGGGFILNEDRTNAENFFKSGTYGVNLDYDDPNNEVTVNSVPEIKTAWNSFETALAASDFADPNSPDYYGKYIDVQSFVDYYLLEEMTRNVDAYWLSDYYTKAADTVVGGVTQRGLISQSPVWDFNLALGAPNYNYASNSDGWNTATELTPFPGTPGVSGFNPQAPYISRLLQDPNFVQSISDRWTQLRSGIFSTSQLKADMDANVAILANGGTNYPVGTPPTQTPNNALVRDFIRWPELGVGVTTVGMYDPNGSWIQGVNMAKNWLVARVNWMDSQFIAQPTVTPGGSFGGPVTVSMSGNAAETTSDTPLITSTSAWHYIAPTGGLGNWYTLGFNSFSGWSTYTGIPAWGYDTTTSPGTSVNFTPLITPTLNTQTAMDGSTKTNLYVTTTFTLTQPQLTAIQSGQMALILQMKYDDGYIAWINGDRVADANSAENTPTPAFNTTINAPQTFGNAVTSLNDNSALTAREYDVSSVASLLVGTNTLAIQGLNLTSSTNTTVKNSVYEDFLLAPQIAVRTYNHPTGGTVYYTTDGSDPRTSSGGISPAAIQYTGSFNVSADERIRARTYFGGTTWSALADNVYVFDANQLRVTELMYNPSLNGGSFPVQDYEFIEFKNIGTTPLGLKGYTFTDGIVFDFPDTTLAPGAYAVVVHDTAAFAERYGTTGINVLGQFASGSFDNDGEHVAISNNFGQVVQDFTYDDTTAWYKSQCDGGGYSLVIKDPTGALANWNDPTQWRPSYLPLGKPGQDDSDTTPPVVTSESYDSANARVQFFFSEPISLGSSPSASVTEILSNSSVTPSGFSASGSSLSVTLPGGLADGIYQMTLAPGSVIDSASNPSNTSAKFTFVLVANGHTLVLPPGDATYAVDQFALGTSAALDLKDNNLICHGGAASSIATLVASGRNGGSWNGSGVITTMPAAAGPSALTTLGVASASDVLGLGAHETSLWHNQTVDGSAVLVKYTYAGDANLDGKINIDDYIRIDSSIPNGLTGYYNGDFNDDGKVNIDDYIVIDSNIPIQGAVFGDAPSSLFGSSQLKIDDVSDAVL